MRSANPKGHPASLALAEMRRLITAHAEVGLKCGTMPVPGFPWPGLRFKESRPHSKQSIGSNASHQESPSNVCDEEACNDQRDIRDHRETQCDQKHIRIPEEHRMLVSGARYHDAANSVIERCIQHPQHP